MLIKLSEINKSYNQRYVLDDLNLEISTAESIAIQGRSGSGKTTLINILAGLLADYNGTYYFQDVEMSQANGKERAKFRQRDIGIITQHFDLLENYTVNANILLGISHLRLSLKQKREKVQDILRYLELSGYEKKRISDLSGGEKQRVAIGRALIKHPKIIIADEPTGALDEETRDQILSLFKKLMTDGTQFIIVTHDDEVAKICDKIYDLKKGYLYQRK